MALIPPFFLDCVLAIGTKDAKGIPSWVGTSFIHGARINVPDAPDADARYAVYLVTNRHVRAALYGQSAFVRCSPTAGESFKDYGLLEAAADGSALWFEHPDSAIDVAALGVDMNKLRKEQMKVQFFSNDTHAAPVARMRDELGNSEGDPVYILGFSDGARN